MRPSAIVAHVAYGVLYVAPIIAAVSFNFAYAYWLVSGFFIAAFVAWLWRRGGWHRFVALVVNAGTSLANLLLAASLYVQGVGFNEEFFHHLNSETRAIGRQTDPVAVVSAWTYLAVVCAAPLFLGWRLRRVVRRRSGQAVALVALFGIVSYAPLLSVLSFAWSRAQELPTPTDSKPVIPVPLEDPRSLVLVFAESMEATYSRHDIFGDDLTPRLTALATRGANFEDMRQVRDAGATITGTVAAMCAMPFRSPMPWEREGVDVPLPGQLCLGDALAAHGYRTVFMGGAPLSFAGKGRFLAEHGFGEVLGLADFLPLLDDPDYRTGWGIHDDSLFEFALRKIDELSNLDGLFALTLLTLDTHHPSGLPSASCPQDVPAGSDMEFAIRCSDRLLSGFVDAVRTRHDDVVVAVFSDHLAQRNELHRTLRRHAKERRLRFSVWGPDIEPARIGRPGTHYDVMPTLLDFLGFEGLLRHNMGASLLRYDSPSLAETMRDKERTP